MISNSNTGATSSDGSFIGLNTQEDFDIWNRETTNMRFATSGIEQMRIGITGNVGIGTDNPKSKLDVNGDMCLRGNLRMNVTNVSSNTTLDNTYSWVVVDASSGYNYNSYRI